MVFREKRQIMLFAVAGVMVGGFVLFRYLPLRKRIKVVNQTKASERRDAGEDQARSRLLPVLEEQVSNLRESIGDYDAKMPGERNLGVFLSSITELMNEYNLAEQVVTPGGEVQSDELNCIPVDIQCKGNLTEMFEFFKRLQRLDRLIRIEEVRLTNDTDFIGEVRLDTRAVIYYQVRLTEE